MRRAFAVVVLAVPAALLTAPVAGAGGGRPAGPPPPGAPAPGPVAVQTGDTTKQHLAVATTQSRRGKRLQANDAATPPSPATAPAMSVSSPLAAACDDAPSVTPLVPGARAPPAGGAAAPSA